MAGAPATESVTARAGPSGPGAIRVGISSWGSLPGFYPPGMKAGDKLAWYARFFTVVEVNVSFYRLVPPRTYAQWLTITPARLLFDVKAFQELTHFQEPPADATFTAFRASYAPLQEAGRFGAVLFQFPPRFANTPATRAYLRRVAREMRGDLTVVEFRNHTWLSPEATHATLALLEELGLVCAVVDEPQIPNDTLPLVPAVTNHALAYVRLHGRNVAAWYRRDGGARYDYDYSPVELAELAGIVTDLARQARNVHVLFNNNARGAGTQNAVALEHLLGIAPEDMPAPPAQPRLFDETH